MARRPDRPEFYELVTEYFIENPDSLTTTSRVADALGLTGEDAEYASDVLGRLHDNMMRRVIGAKGEQSIANVCHHRLRSVGLFYRVANGVYVLDTGARITNNHQIAGNRWPVSIGNVPRTSQAGKKHPYRNKVEIGPDPKVVPPASPAPAVQAPEPEPAAAPEPVPEPVPEAPVRLVPAPVAEATTPADASTGITLLGRDAANNRLMLRMGDEIVTVEIVASMPAVGVS